MPRDPKFWPTDPEFRGEFESELRNEELKGSGVSGSEGDNSPFRGATPKLASNSDSPNPKPHSTHFLVPTGIFGPIYRTEQYFGLVSRIDKMENMHPAQSTSLGAKNEPHR